MALTLVEAQAEGRCRICEQRIDTTGQSWNWHQRFAEVKEPAHLVLDYGKEFAHYDCLNKCKVCGRELIRNKFPRTQVNEAIYQVSFARQVHLACSPESFGDIGLINNLGDLAKIIDGKDMKMRVVIKDGKGECSPTVEFDDGKFIIRR